jgi:hypothetical protein
MPAPLTHRLVPDRCMSRRTKTTGISNARDSVGTLHGHVLLRLDYSRIVL